MSTERIPADLLIRDLTATSDKIRTLAKAGYSRTEIRDLLGIRYQHVRKVLLDAGITHGLRRQKEVPQSPIPIDIAPSPMIPAGLLLSAGFWLVGEWTRPQTGEITLEGHAPNEPGVYAFVLDDTVVYVGLTLRSLRGRMSQYRRGDKRQRTSARIKARITVELETGRAVKVLVATPKSSAWNELPVSTAAGLEVGLIQAIRPEWNIQIGTAKAEK
jgi:hypothetical protein